jgi:Fimbrial assembly protein (PilN)
MPQHINLLDASLQRKRETLGSITGLVAVLATFGASVALAMGLQSFSAKSQAQSVVLEQELAALQARVAALGTPAPSRQAIELARLRAVDAGQRRLRAALESGQAGSTRGYSEYFLALSRQTQGTLWLTGFTVAADGRALEIGGRMTEARQLPDYLRRLNGEPLFKGREFAQLSLKTVEPAAAVGGNASYAEFALRSTPGTPEAAR